MGWQIQQAKQQFSELVRRAMEDGPQIVTKHGREAVVVVSMREFRQRAGSAADFKAFLRSGPDLSQLRIRRDRRPARRVEL
jgi:prevent-host-death family protein